MPRKLIKSFMGDDGLVLNMLFYSGGRNILRDSSPYRNDGTLLPAFPANAPVWARAPWGGWSLANDTSYYVSVPDAPSLKLTTKLTIEHLGWLTATAPGVDKPMVYKYTGGNGYTFVNGFTHQFIFRIWNAWAAASISFLMPTAIDRFHQRVATYDNGTAELFLDGISVAGPTLLVVASIGTNNDPLYVGADRGLVIFWVGPKALLRIYNRVLSPAEIAEHWEAYRSFIV